MEKKNIYVVVKSGAFQLAREVCNILSDELGQRDIEHKVAGDGEKLLFTAHEPLDANLHARISGILFTEHALNRSLTSTRPAIAQSQISMAHNLHIAVAGDPNSGKTTLSALFEQILNSRFSTTFPVIEYTLDGMSGYPDAALKEYLVSGENLNLLRDRVIVNLIPQGLATRGEVA